MATFTMMGNNILQSFIYENKYNESAPFAILPTERFEGFMKAYRECHPDVIALHECDEGWHDVIDSEQGLPSLGYAAATNGFSSEELRMIRNVIYYDTERLKVVDAGYQMYSGTSHGFIANPWCFSWAVLEAIEGGERFICSSTHLVWGSADNFAERDRFAKELLAKLSEFEERYDAPVAAMGDYNAHIHEPAYITLCGHFLSARECECERVNMEYKTTNRKCRIPELDTDGKGFIDHCFISRKGMTPLKYETLIELNDYSDHVPQRFTFEI